MTNNNIGGGANMTEQEKESQELVNYIVGAFAHREFDKADKHLNDYIETLKKQITDRENNRVTYDSVAPSWVGDEPAWILIAIQGGNVIWESEEPVTKPMIQSLYYKATGKYSSSVATTEECRKAAEQMYTTYKQKEDSL